MLRNEASIRESARGEPIDRFFTPFRMTMEGNSPNPKKLSNIFAHKILKLISSSFLSQLN